jgi:hypothetical protein
MAYQINQFDGVVLPIYNPSQDHSGTEVQSSLLAVTGGMIDLYGSRRKPGRGQKISITGLYEGQSRNLIDHAGNFLVDETGDYIITGAESDDLRGQIDALRAKIGGPGQLNRVWLGGVSLMQWVTARLLRVNYNQSTDDRLYKAVLRCEFETAMEAWRGGVLVMNTIALVAGTNTFYAPRDGTATVEDAIITVAPSSTMTSILMQGNGIDWTWSGSLLSSQTLVINCGALTVLKSGADNFSGFTLNAGHTAQSWLPLLPGKNTLTITTDAPGDFTVQYYNQWL